MTEEQFQQKNEQLKLRQIANKELKIFCESNGVDFRTAHATEHKIDNDIPF